MPQSQKKNSALFSPDLTPSDLANAIYVNIDPHLSFYNQPFWAVFKGVLTRPDYNTKYYPIVFKAAEEILNSYTLSPANTFEKSTSNLETNKNKTLFFIFICALYNNQTSEFGSLFEASFEIKKLFISNPNLVCQIYKEGKNEEHLINFLNIKTIEKVNKEFLKNYELLYAAHKNSHAHAQKLILSIIIEHYKNDRGFTDLPKIALVIAGQTSSEEVKGRFFYKEKRQSKAQIIIDMLDASIFPAITSMSWQEQVKSQYSPSSTDGPSAVQNESVLESLCIGSLFYLLVSDSAKTEHIDKIVSCIDAPNTVIYKFFINVFSQNIFLSSLKKESLYISEDYEKLTRLFLAGKFDGAQICTIITRLCDCYERFHNKPDNSSHYLYMMANLIKVASTMATKGSRDFFDMHPRFLSFLTTQEVKKSTLQNDFVINFDLFYAYLFSIDKTMPITPKALGHWEDGAKNIILKITSLPITLAYMKSLSSPQSVYKIEPHIQTQVQGLIDRALELSQVKFFRPEMKCSLFLSILKNIKEFQSQIDIYDEPPDGKKSYAHILHSLVSNLHSPELVDKCLIAIEDLRNAKYADLKYIDKIDKLKQNLKALLEQKKISIALNSSHNENIKTGVPSIDKFKI